MTNAGAVDLALVHALETRMFNAWPAVETHAAEGWLLRWAHGYSKRANSASAIIAGADADDALIDFIEDRFRSWATRICFRLSPLAAPGLDDRLAARGYSEIDVTAVMLAPLSRDLAGDPRVTIAPAPPAGWLAANASAYGGEKADMTALGAIVSRIRLPAAFATLTVDGQALAWGIAVVERGYVVLQDIVVAPAARGGGLGRALVGSLLAWGQTRGAEHAYLQVMTSNERARKLYRSLGFHDAYIYRHRVRT